MLDRLGNLVRSVGRELPALREGGSVHGRWEGAQLKTEADLIAHRLLSEKLRLLEPNLPVLSEEDPGSHSAHRPGHYWLIDPIDGTASFAGGYPGYVTQAALMVDAQPVLAAVYAPAFDMLYTAERGRGATANGEVLRVSSDDSRCILIDNYPQPRNTAVRVYEALGCSGYIESGSISLKICRVAEGAADLFFKDVAVRDWDVAAPHLILREAGGALRVIDGGPYIYEGPLEKPGIVAARSGELAERVITELRSRKEITGGS